MATDYMRNSSPVSNEAALAIVGMAGRFPGATNLDEFWQNLAGGIKSIRRFSREELLAAGVAPDLLAQENYICAGSPLEGIAYFDAAFFGYSQHEAEVMDPQHRLFLECAWEALEDAAYDAQRFAGLIGVFAGSGFGSYLFNNIYLHPELIEYEYVTNLRFSRASRRT
jgi:phthiocerol/phenolphthiocerol synthesis type-I polyketide synthase E